MSLRRVNATLLPNQDGAMIPIEIGGAMIPIAVGTEEEITTRNIIAVFLQNLPDRLSVNIRAVKTVYRKTNGVRSAAANPVMSARLSALVGAVFLKRSRVILPTINGERNERLCENVPMPASTDAPSGNAAKQWFSIRQR
jgi:hypothetical protein